MRSIFSVFAFLLVIAIPAFAADPRTDERVHDYEVSLRLGVTVGVAGSSVMCWGMESLRVEMAEWCERY